ncbi:hypothetical protein D9613_012915 [Agrocybe pediades]|uniref:Uncharacterized protein n=1 Tax=Agrocybe pediades TaxID=84607 RepID=A0A8H4QFG2_9AGAR|nr:hypothetical protein D9613_012915 [Agrocybe pediades]
MLDETAQASRPDQHLWSEFASWTTGDRNWKSIVTEEGSSRGVGSIASRKRDCSSRTNIHQSQSMPLHIPGPIRDRLPPKTRKCYASSSSPASSAISAWFNFDKFCHWSWNLNAAFFEGWLDRFIRYFICCLDLLPSHMQRRPSSSFNLHITQPQGLPRHFISLLYLLLPKAEMFNSRCFRLRTGSSKREDIDLPGRVKLTWLGGGKCLRRKGASNEGVDECRLGTIKTLRDGDVRLLTIYSRR